MGRLPKRAKYSKEETEEFIETEKVQAKKQAIALLERCLDTQLLSGEEVEEFTKEVSQALGLNAVKDTDHIHQSQYSNNKSSKALKALASYNNEHQGFPREDDQHNEVCEVCELGGELICCDTCSLVFHVKCVRPILNNIPRGPWSCAHCVLEDLAEGDKTTAKQAIQAMDKLSRQYSNHTNEESENRSDRVNKSGDVTIAFTGRKFIVRKVARKQILEIGRYNNLKDALSSVPRVQQLRSITSSFSTGNSIITTRHQKLQNHPNHEESTSIRCSFCLDDPFVRLCAFCGCKYCFGKFDTNLLHFCQNCHRESHSYCATSNNPNDSIIQTTSSDLCTECLRARLENSNPESNTNTTNINQDSNAANQNTHTMKTRKSSELIKPPRDKQQNEIESNESKSIHHESENNSSVTSQIHPESETLQKKPNNAVETQPNLVTSTTTATASSETEKPVYRGRGRPPGSGKKTKDPASNQTSNSNTSKQSTRKLNKQSESKSSSIIITNSTSATIATEDEMTSIEKSNKLNEENIHGEENRNKLEIENAAEISTAADSMANDNTNVNPPQKIEFVTQKELLEHLELAVSRTLTDGDLIAFERLRVIGHVKDLQQLLQVLQLVQQRLIEKIREKETDFQNIEEPEENTSSTQTLVEETVLPQNSSESQKARREGAEQAFVGQKRKRNASKDFTPTRSHTHDGNSKFLYSPHQSLHPMNYNNFNVPTSSQQNQLPPMGNYTITQSNIQDLDVDVDLMQISEQDQSFDEPPANEKYHDNSVNNIEMKVLSDPGIENVVDNNVRGNEQPVVNLDSTHTIIHNSSIDSSSMEIFRAAMLHSHDEYHVNGSLDHQTKI